MMQPTLALLCPSHAHACPWPRSWSVDVAGLAIIPPSLGYLRWCERPPSTPRRATHARAAYRKARASALSEQDTTRTRMQVEQRQVEQEEPRWVPTHVVTVCMSWHVNHFSMATPALYCMLGM